MYGVAGWPAFITPFAVVPSVRFKTRFGCSLEAIAFWEGKDLEWFYPEDQLRACAEKMLSYLHEKPWEYYENWEESTVGFVHVYERIVSAEIKTVSDEQVRGWMQELYERFLEQYTESMEGVVYHAQSMYSCSQDAQEVLKAKIKEHNLNRVVIAACSPRTHEPLFQETLKDAGLNRCLFEMVNIRDHCSWVHANEPAAATEKSKDLVRMGVAKARHIQPLPEQTVPVTAKALVLGGGVAGLTAALTLAEQGFQTTVVEKEGTLGGHLQHLSYTLQGDTVSTVLGELIDTVKKNKKIELLTNTELSQVSGFVGNFSSVLTTSKGKKTTETTLDHGVIIIATGGREYRPEVVLDNPIKYSEAIVTQRELEQRLAGKGKNPAPKSVVMVQCAGSRGDDLNYCSKVCCNHAVKNALKIKALDPSAQVVVLYRDMRTYGFAEDAYRQAREKGVVFIPYTMDNKPKFKGSGKKTSVTFFDPILRDEVTMTPEVLTLSVGIVASKRAFQADVALSRLELY